jgi:hypothetical protein
MSYMTFLALKKLWIQQIKDINDFAASLKLQQIVNVDQPHISLYCCSVCMERWNKHLTNHNQGIQPQNVKRIIYLLYFLKRQKCRLVRSFLIISNNSMADAQTSEVEVTRWTTCSLSCCLEVRGILLLGSSGKL